MEEEKYFDSKLSFSSSSNGSLALYRIPLPGCPNIGPLNCMPSKLSFSSSSNEGLALYLYASQCQGVLTWGPCIVCHQSCPFLALQMEAFHCIVLCVYCQGVKRATLSVLMWRLYLCEEEVFRRGALLRVWIQDEPNFSPQSK